MSTYRALLEEAKRKTVEQGQDEALRGKLLNGLVQLRADLSDVKLYDEEQFSSLIRALFAESELAVQLSKGVIKSDKKPILVTVGLPSGTRFYIYAVVESSAIMIHYEVVPPEGAPRPAL